MQEISKVDLDDLRGQQNSHSLIRDGLRQAHKVKISTFCFLVKNVQLGIIKYQHSLNQDYTFGEIS